MRAKSPEEVESILAKLKKRAEEYKQAAIAADKEYDIVTDQYMNGDIHYDVGKYQRRLIRHRDTCRRKAERELGRIDKIKEQYGLSEEQQSRFITM